MCGGKCEIKERPHHEECSQEELDILDGMLADEEDAKAGNPFHQHCLDEQNLSFTELEKKGKKGAAQTNVSKIDFTPNEHFITNEENEELLSDEIVKDSAQNVRSEPTLRTPLRVAAERKARRVNIEAQDAKTLAPNGTAGSTMDWAKKHKLDFKQRQAFYTMTSSFVLTHTNEALTSHQLDERAQNTWSPSRTTINEHLQLLKDLNGRSEMRLFLSGAGGTGKSNVIDHVVSHCENFCKNTHAPFTDGTIVVTALTGVAAVLIEGETLHSASHVWCKHITSDVIQSWSDARLAIVDEVSFADPELLEEIDAALKDLMECPSKPHGGLNIAFIGDFRQLEPVKQEPLYRDQKNPVWFAWINDHIELTINHRSKADKRCAALLDRFQKGTPTEKDINLMNMRVLGRNECPPRNTRCACHANHDRCAINNASFMKHTKDTHSKDPKDTCPSHAIVIGASNITWESQAFGSKPFTLKKNLFERCSEADCKSSQNGRLDPCLKLHHGCPIMLTENRDVRRGKANGCPCQITRIVLKDDCTPEKNALTVTASIVQKRKTQKESRRARNWTLMLILRLPSATDDVSR